MTVVNGQLDLPVDGPLTPEGVAKQAFWAIDVGRAALRLYVLAKVRV